MNHWWGNNFRLRLSGKIQSLKLWAPWRWSRMGRGAERENWTKGYNRLSDSFLEEEHYGNQPAQKSDWVWVESKCRALWVWTLDNLSLLSIFCPLNFNLPYFKPTLFIQPEWVNEECPLFMLLLATSGFLWEMGPLGLTRGWFFPKNTVIASEFWHWVLVESCSLVCWILSLQRNSLLSPSYAEEA